MLKNLAILSLLFLSSCNVLQPPPDLTWDHDPEAVIIKTTDGGGLEPLAAARNRIPDGVVFGDGRIIWTTFEDGRRQVRQGQLSEDEMMTLLETFADKGFWRLDDFYRPREEVFDSSTTRLTVNLISENKSVGEYHNGAPRVFDELVGLVSSGAGAEGDTYMPQMGYLSIMPIDGVYNPSDILAWESDAVDFRLADAEDGWVEGPVLAQAWTIVNRKYWSPIVVEDDIYYELYLEIPELTGRDPTQ